MMSLLLGRPDVHTSTRSDKGHYVKVSVTKLSSKGRILQVYESITEAADKNGLYISGISRCLAGDQTLCGGFQWKHTETTSATNTNLQDLRNLTKSRK